MTEERVAVLEEGVRRTGVDVCNLKTSVDELGKDVAGIKTDVAGIKQTLDAFKRWGWLIAGSFIALLVTAMWKLIVSAS